MSQVADNTRLYRGQGQVFLAKRVSGQPAGFEFIGNVSELMLNPKTEKIEHPESQTGNNSIDKIIERALGVEVSMTIDSIASANLARLVFGKVTENPAATITAETKKAYVGKYLFLDNINVQAFTSLTDAGATTTYVLGTDYELIDLGQGMLRILDGGAIVDGQDVELNYDTGESETVAAFSQPNTEYWMRVNGLNSAEDDSPVAIEAFKVRFAPTDDVPLINNEGFAEYKQSGNALFDSCRPVDGKFGRYFSVTQLTAAAAGADC